MKKSHEESAASIALFLAICLKLNSFPSSWARCQLNWLSTVEEEERNFLNNSRENNRFRVYPYIY